MSRLDDLIAELCPDGVEYKCLGDIAIELFRGTGITRDQIVESGTPCVRYGEIHTTYSIWFDKCRSYVNADDIKNKKWINPGDILFAITSENVEDIAKSTAYIGNDRCLAGGDIVVMRHDQNPRYLSYALSTPHAIAQKTRGKIKSKVVHSNIPSIQSISIPLPPLPIQEEIVRIMDTFSELTKELTTRKKQYQYYRNKILVKNVDTELFGLKDIAIHSSSGSTPLKNKSEYYVNGNIPWLRTQEVVFNEIYSTSEHITELAVQETSAKWIPENCIIVAISGATAGRCAINKIPLTTNQHCLNIEIDATKAYYKYIFYCICNQYDELISRKEGARGDLNSSKILSLKIPLPSLEEQYRIASILDRFDVLCNDLTSGLPAEIEARRKQYEYYRDRLLTFKEREA